MFNIFEQPWTLFIAAVVVLYAIFRFRSIFPQKRRWWQWLIPVFIAIAAFGLEELVQTDVEKINALIDTGAKAVEQENISAIDSLISADYQDSYHSSKEELMTHCGEKLSQPLVEENKKIGLQLEISPPTAIIVLTALTKFEKDSYVTRSYKQSFRIKVKLYLQKQPDKRWLINRAELLEIDRQPFNWRQIR